MTFVSRDDAGEQLGRALAGKYPDVGKVIGLPRGGVVVAAEVARMLQVPLDVIVVRKIGHPQNREFAVGALAERDVMLLSDDAARCTGSRQQELESVIREESARLETYRHRFHIRDAGDTACGTAIIVDDGLATGATTEAAVISARKSGWNRVVVAAPVASDSAIDRLRRVADDVFALVVDPDFVAVGAYYDSFPQTSDDEVMLLLSFVE